MIAIGGLLSTEALLLLLSRIVPLVSCCCFEGGVGRLLLFLGDALVRDSSPAVLAGIEARGSRRFMAWVKLGLFDAPAP